MFQGDDPKISCYVHYQDGLVTIDFRGCSSRAISEIYQVFALYCARQQVRWAMLRLGNEDVDVHFALRDTLVAVARTAGIPLSFKLALVASSMPYPAALSDLASLGCDVEVFVTEQQASQWLLQRNNEQSRAAEGAAAPQPALTATQPSC